MSTPKPLTRRRFLEAAGGITFLALVANGRGAFTALLEPDASGHAGGLPEFTAAPYIQPGPKGGKLVEGAESVVVAWQTTEAPAEFAVFVNGRRKPIVPNRTERHGAVGTTTMRYNYAAEIGGLALGKRYTYQVKMNGQRLAEGYFTTRKKRGENVRFVSFGDNCHGSVRDHEIAYQAYQAHPDFVMNTGDNVYDSGLDSEYAKFFFPIYNADKPAPQGGAPLLRSVPFYTVLGNHDSHYHNDNGLPSADFDKHPDALGFYTAMHLPLNGPEAPPSPTPIEGQANLLDSFRATASDRYPRQANYSYDYGDAHFTCLDSNVYVDPTNEALQAWIAADLAGARDARWKFVCFHHPPFNVGVEHYTEQHMRALCPLFEQHGVDMVLSGHEHVYQRNRPFRFAPTDLANAKKVGTSKRHVPGTFTIDRAFDGKTVTKPEGVIYLTTGAGGANLYDPTLNNAPENWKHPEDNNVEYVALFDSDRHSLSVFDLEPNKLTMRQIDQDGKEIDRIVITKG